MELRKLRGLIELVNASNLVEVEVRLGEGSVRVARSGERAPSRVAPIAVAAPAVLERAVAAVVANEVVANAPVHDAPPGHVVRSSAVGMLYAGPARDEPPFVTIGKRVKTGDTLSLIEALKTIQPVEAPVSGTVLEILIEDGQAVEFDQPLFVIG